MTWTPNKVAFAAWLLLALALGGGIGSFNLPTYYALRNHGVAVTGSVIEYTPRYHDSVLGEYVVNGERYQCRSAFVAPPNGPKREMHAGDPLQIVYLPERPDRCTLGDPAALIPNELASVLSAALLGPAFIVWVNLIRWKERNRKV
ncbi:MAG TPA: DUF3592 domain-containing protein [Myxococcales bacterium]|nr:DUF3592 domain-containing protein [Myxococcales bacterium]